MTSWQAKRPQVVSAPPADGREEFCSLTIPEKSATDRVIALLLFVASCSYLLLFLRFSYLSADEGITLQGAQRILSGQVMYRDFFYFVTPGSEYWMALLFKLFGNSILVARAALVIYGGLFSVFTYLIARRVASRGHSVLAISPTVAFCLPYYFVSLHNWDSTLAALLSLYCAVRFVESARPSWAFGMGTLAAFTSLFEQSKGAGLVLGLSAGFIGLAVLGQSGFRIPISGLVAMGAGFVWPCLLTVAYFAVNGAFTPMLADLLWPLRHYSQANAFSYGDPVLAPVLANGAWSWLIFLLLVLVPFFVISALPIFAAPVAVYSGLRLRAAGPHGEVARHYWIVSVVLLGLLGSIVATRRPDADHILFQAPLFCLVLAWTGEGAKSRFMRQAKAVGCACCALSFATLGLALLLLSRGDKTTVRTRQGVLDVRHDGAAVLEYVQRHVTAGEEILVYPYHPLFYYLTRTFSVGPYDYLQPGLNETSQFNEVGKELAAAPPEAVLLEPSFYSIVAVAFPSTPVAVLGAKDPVAEYIASNYHACRDFPVRRPGFFFVFMVRNDLSCPEKGEIVTAATQEFDNAK